MTQRKKLVLFAEASRYLDREALMKVGASLFVGDIDLPDNIPQQVEDGGAGSGNWGHKGRHGHWGGSAKGTGGKAMRKDIQIKYEGAKKTQNFRAAYKKAQSHTYSTQNLQKWHESLSDDERVAVNDQYENVKKQANSKETYEHYVDRLFKMMTAVYTPAVSGQIVPKQPQPAPQNEPQNPSQPQPSVNPNPTPTNENKGQNNGVQPVPANNQAKTPWQQQGHPKPYWEGLQAAKAYNAIFNGDHEAIKNFASGIIKTGDVLTIHMKQYENGTVKGKEKLTVTGLSNGNFEFSISDGITTELNAEGTANMLQMFNNYKNGYGVSSVGFKAADPQSVPKPSSKTNGQFLKSALIYSMVGADSKKIESEVLSKMSPTDRIVVEYTTSTKYTMQIKKQGDEFLLNVNGKESKHKGQTIADVLAVIDAATKNGEWTTEYYTDVPVDTPMGLYQSQETPTPQPVAPEPQPVAPTQQPIAPEPKLVEPTPQPVPTKPKHNAVTGKDMASSYVPDVNAKSKINDIIHQQGFDGVPKVVSESEFQSILKSGSMPLMLRTYSGISAEQTKEFDTMLQSGEWYVECSTGGAYEGQGMYTVASYNYGSTYEQHELKMQMGRYQRYSRQKAMIDAQVPEGLHKIKDTHTGQITMIEQTPVSFSKGKPKDGQIVYIKSYSGTTKHKNGDSYVTLDSSYRGYYYSKGKLYYINDQDIEFDPQHESYMEGPKITPSTKYYRQADKEAYNLPQRFPVIRAMTLDPSAKILTSSQAQELCMTYNTSLQERRYEQLASGIESGQIGFDASKAFPSTNTTMHGLANGSYEAQLKQLYGSDEESFRKDYQTMVCAYLYNKVQQQNEHMNGAKNPFNTTTMSGAKRKMMLQIIKDGHAPSAVWMTKALEKLAPKPQPITDHGQIAALYGYDAINAQDTGNSSAGGNYMIVVNRTKVILQQEPVIKRNMYKPKG